MAVARRRACQKRGGGKTVGESALLADPDAREVGLAQFCDRESSPELVAQLGEDYRHVMEALGGHLLRTVAQMQLEGHNSKEISERLSISTRSVERKLRLIRTIWERIAAGEP
jgi:DNA-directed RNA polymerase specialized sigma24 family protein